MPRRPAPHPAALALAATPAAPAATPERGPRTFVVQVRTRTTPMPVMVDVRTPIAQTAERSAAADPRRVPAAMLRCDEERRGTSRRPSSVHRSPRDRRERFARPGAERGVAR